MVLETVLYGSLWKISFNTISKYAQNHTLIFHACEYNNINKIIVPIAYREMKLQRDGDMSLINIAANRFKKTRIKIHPKKMSSAWSDTC